jgi:hypothetical protein
MAEELFLEMALVISEIPSDLISRVCPTSQERLPNTVICGAMKLTKCCMFDDLRFDEPSASLTFRPNNEHSVNE